MDFYKIFENDFFITWKVENDPTTSQLSLLSVQTIKSLLNYD